MTDRITAGQFHDAEGVGDWRVLFGGACAYFATGSFATGVALVAEIGRLADEADHHPDVDLRYPGVTVRLWTHDVDGLSQRDVVLARRISAAARDLGIAADPDPLQGYNLTIDALVPANVLPFWAALLGYRIVGEEDLADPRDRGPSIRFQVMDTARTQRNRVHLDVWVPHDQAEARIAAALVAGGRLVSDEHAPAWWVLADMEGNEACVATWQRRD
ncbi:VOC family protein [Hamadaea sp. NPDC050747]|uniref:VOC family protein n=1 Tax=Hamadaea sp. NPDC050747 TaxID=3155789 RepID=UPI0033C2FEF8